MQRSLFIHTLTFSDELERGHKVKRGKETHCCMHDRIWLYAKMLADKWGLVGYHLAIETAPLHLTGLCVGSIDALQWLGVLNTVKPGHTINLWKSGM